MCWSDSVCCCCCLYVAVCTLSFPLGCGCSDREALQQECVHRESRRPALVSWPHVQPCRMAATVHTHTEPGAHQHPLWSKPRYWLYICLFNFVHDDQTLSHAACSNGLLSFKNFFLLVYNEVFWKGCLPGSQGNLCKVCMGGTGEAATKRCTDNHNERYYGNMGALRYGGFCSPVG